MPFLCWGAVSALLLLARHPDMEPLILALVAVIGYLIYNIRTYKSRHVATRVLWRNQK